MKLKFNNIIGYENEIFNRLRRDGVNVRYYEIWEMSRGEYGMADPRFLDDMSNHDTDKNTLVPGG
jgi:hypothetical protein